MSFPTTSLLSAPKPCLNMPSPCPTSRTLRFLRVRPPSLFFVFFSPFKFPLISPPPTLDRLIEFLLACRGSYNVHIPYHNFRHVVDVLQAVFFFLLQLAALPPFGSGDPPAKHPGSLSHIITPMDAFTLLVVAIGHDVGHPGVNNTFLIALKTPLAQLYNDKSVLESFHCAAFSQVVKRHWPEAWDLRKTMIDMILATDMALHSDFMVQLEKLRRRYEDEMKGCNYDGLSPKVVLEHRTLLCALLIKCADISNVVSPFIIIIVPHPQLTLFPQGSDTRMLCTMGHHLD